VHMYLMTDLEGVAGVINGVDYLSPTGRYYEKAKRLLTAEVNAAIEGFAAGGFTSFFVVDGHGQGAVDIELLDPRARLSRGWPRPAYPFGMNRNFDAAAVVGQHAKAGTPMSHLTHTGWFDVLDQKINGLSIGEFGEMALLAGEFDVPVIFAAGEKAFCEEVEALTPWVVTAAVLEGVIPDTGDDLDTEAYTRFHEAAVHLQPQAAGALIRERGEQAARRFVADRAAFKPLKIDPPYRLERWIRPSKDKPGRHTVTDHPDSIVGVLRARFGG